MNLKSTISVGLILGSYGLTSCIKKSAGGSQRASEASQSSQIAGLDFGSDYFAGYTQAKNEAKYLMVYFRDAKDAPAKKIFEEVTLADKSVQEQLASIVRVVVPLNAKIKIKDKDASLIDQPGFEHLERGQGIAFVDLKNKTEKTYKLAKAYAFRSDNQAASWKLAPFLEHLKSPVPASELIVPNPNNYKLSNFEFEVIRLTNIERQKLGRAPFAVRGPLVDGCRQHSNWMARGGGLNHASGQFAENIAWNQRTPREVVTSWMNSPGHRANILGRYRFIGVSDASYYWCQRFVH